MKKKKYPKGKPLNPKKFQAEMMDSPPITSGFGSLSVDKEYQKWKKRHKIK